MQARGFLNYRLKYCWPKVIHGICQSNELKRQIKEKLGAKQGSTKNLERPWPTHTPLRIAIACLYFDNFEFVIFMQIAFDACVSCATH